MDSHLDTMEWRVVVHAEIASSGMASLRAQVQPHVRNVGGTMRTMLDSWTPGLLDSQAQGPTDPYPQVHQG